VCTKEEIRNAYKILIVNLKGRDQLGDRGVGGIIIIIIIIIIKWISQE
jgi:hypothetical protein